MVMVHTAEGRDFPRETVEVGWWVRRGGLGRDPKKRKVKEKRFEWLIYDTYDEQI